MTQQILGPSGSPRRRWTVLVPLLVAFALGLMYVAGAQAVHDTGKFQLDGDALTSSPSNPPAAEDWDMVCPTTSPPSRPASQTPHCLGGTTASEHTFIADAFIAANDDIFKGGTDAEDVSSWQWKQAGPSPDKADIEQAFAAQYTVSAAPYNGDEVLFFGGTRFANNGSTNIGFWFFQQEVTLAGANTVTSPQGVVSCPVQSGCGFTGLHTEGNVSLGGSTPGDIFILSEFTQGGVQPTIKVFEWVGPGNATPDYLGGNNCFTNSCTLQPVPIPFTPGFTDNRCATGAPPVSDDPACALVNSGLDASPWFFNAKENGVPANTFNDGELYEGGLNLTGLGFGDACFQSTLLNTRSSPSGTSVLQDFAIGGFGACTSDIVTTPANGSGTNLTDSDDANDVSSLPDIKIGTGATGVTVTDNASVSITGIPNWSGTVSFFLCGPLSYEPVADPPLCTSGGVQAGTKAVDTNPNTPAETTATSDPLKLTSVGRYCWRGFFESPTNGVPDATDASAGECFEVIPVTPTITTNATPAAEKGSAISDTATLTGTANKPATNGSNATYPSILAPATVSNGAAANGSITFKAYKNSATCDVTALDFTSGAFTVSGDSPPAYGPASYTPGTTGTYRWIASYTGDTPNTKGVSGACNDANETSVIVDAKIELSPVTDTNEVNDDHEITATVSQDTGNGSGFVDAPDGTLVTFSLLNNTANASFVGGVNTCVTTDGQCSVFINTTTAGSVDIHATTTFTVTGTTVQVTRATGTGAPNSADANKIYVDAFITVSPLTDTNEVNDNHEITATVKQATGSVDQQNNPVFTNAPDGTLVTFSLLNNTAGADFENDVNTCTTTNGQCSVFINTSTAGSVDIHATTTFTVGGTNVEVTRETDGVGNNSIDANKVFVDANVTITPPLETNVVGDPHTFTVTVMQNDGLAADEGGDGFSGFFKAPAGTPVTVTLVNSDGAQWAFTGAGDTCASPGGLNASGQCTVTFTSPTAGTVTGNASVTFLVGGVSLTRDTDPATANVGAGPGGSGPAIKHFLAGSISWLKHDNAGELQGGATFQLCQTHGYDIDTDLFVDIADVCIEVVDNANTPGYVGNDEDADPGEFLVSGRPLGRYTVTETVAPPGFIVDPMPEIVELTPGNTTGSVPSDDPFVNNRPIVKITGFGYANTADLDPVPTHGIVSGTATFTANLHNYGLAAAELSNSSIVASATGPAGGTFSCDGDPPAPALSKALTGTIAANGDLGPFTLVCTYENMPDEKVIGAEVNVNYTLNGLERTASGSPATVSFTVQSD